MFGIEAALEGRLGRDPELRMVKGGAMAMVTLALAVTELVKAGDEPKTTWVNAKMFGDKATVAAEALVNGDVVYCEGKLSLDSWEGRDGQQRHGLSLLASKAEPLGKIGHRRPKSASTDKQNRSTGGNSQYRRAAEAQAPLARSHADMDDEIPF